jgi:light-regulated signal transduction histidine kinase (bacteriophytochrome)
MRSLISSDGLSVVAGQRVVSLPESLDRTAALSVAEFMASTHQDLLVVASIERDLVSLRGALSDHTVFAGLLGIQIQGDAIITIIWWRSELTETIKWAGRPDTRVDAGQGGSTLTPRHSFEAWKEVVRGSSRAWDQTDKFAARELKAILQQVALDQIRATEHERTALLAILGHDLRDPLQAIDMAVTLMGRGLATTGDSAKRIEYSSRRMQSIIAYILDVSRLRKGVGLAMELKVTPLTPLLRTLLEEAQLAFPGVEMELSVAELGRANIDEGRLVQAISNLLSNARQHGDLRFPIRINAFRARSELRIEISNRLAAGQHFLPGAMTSPLKPSSAVNARNKTGLGLGLYIANAIVGGHGGELKSQCVSGEVTFSIVLNSVNSDESEVGLIAICA